MKDDVKSPETTELFNAAIGTVALSAVYEMGLLDALHNRELLVVADYCRENDLHLPSVDSLLAVLNHYEIVEYAPAEGQVWPGRLFDEAYREKGYFLWLVRGYGYLLQNLAAAAHNSSREGDFIRKDGRFIAMAGRDYGGQYVDPHFSQVLNQADYQVVADLGCGSGERLIKLAKERPELRGVGVEVNAGAVEVARQAVQAAGLQGRLQIVQADVSRLTAEPLFADVDTIFSFFMGHDLWPRENCLATLQGVYTVFPQARRFLLCDTYRSEQLDSGHIPIFTLGFEMIHGVMGQYIPTMADWQTLFPEAGWRCVNEHPIEIPFSCIFDLRRADS